MPFLRGVGTIWERGHMSAATPPPCSNTTVFPIAMQVQKQLLAKPQSNQALKKTNQLFMPYLADDCQRDLLLTVLMLTEQI